MEQKYDIGHGVIITPSISGIRAEWFTDDEKKSSKSVGLSWPITKPDVEVEIISSIDNIYYYPKPMARPIHGFWLSKQTYPTQEAVNDAAPSGIFGKTYAQFKEPDGTEYYRVSLLFNTWDVKSSPDVQIVAGDDDLVLDYAGIVGVYWENDEAKFNAEIAFTGRTAREIIEAIGAWSPEPKPEPVITKLFD